MAEEVKSRLGRGLAALIGDAGDESRAVERVRSQRRVPVEYLRPNPRNPRKDFLEQDLEDLSASVKERGVIQPILVRNVRGQNDAYEIIAGERRWRAAQRAGLHDVPVVVVEATDRESLEFAIIENVQRADLNAIEEALGYESLMQEFQYSADAVAKIVGKSRPHVANTLRLLKLSDSVKALVREGKLSAGHARSLIGQPNADALADEIITKGLNVRQVEARTRETEKPTRGAQRTAKPPAKDADTAALEKRLTDQLGLVVEIDHAGESGTLTVSYKTLEQLDEIVRLLEAGGASARGSGPRVHQL